MATLYYMIIEGRQAGPFPAEALKAQGLMPDTYVWREGLQNWVAASQLPELDYLFRANPPMESLSPSSPPSGSYYDRQPGTVPPDPYRDDSRYGAPVPHTNWLPWAVVATVAAFLLSCIGMIFGIIGIVQANKANTAYQRGDFSIGDSANSTARLMTIIAFVFAAIGLFGSIWIFRSSDFMENYQNMIRSMANV